MTEKKAGSNRYLLLIVAAIANFPTGSAGIWPIFQPYAREKFHIGHSEANTPFSVFMAGFVIGNIIGGQLQKKTTPRKGAAIGSILMCVGLFLASFVPVGSPWLLSVTYGVMGGMGAGMTYNVIIAAITKWFPDKRGMASGIIVCMVGANSFIMSPIANGFLAKYGFSRSIAMVAIFFAVVTALGLWAVQTPPEGYMADYVPRATAVKAGRNYTSSEMIRTRNFYLVAGALALGTSAYFLLNPMVKSLGTERGLTEVAAVSTVMVASVMNCVGRLVIPWVSDKVGRNTMLYVLFIMCMVSVLVMTKATGVLYSLCAVLITCGYGGFFGIFPAVAVDQFGSENSGLNYGIIMIGYGIVCLLCPVLVAKGINFAFICSAICCGVGILLVALLEKDKKKQKSL